jgi:biopolymer transport protein ExbD
MARKTIHGGLGPEGGGLGHSAEERPWVFSMIDCFLLIVNFFVITFKFKGVEPVLPQKMPPGMVRHGPTVVQVNKEPLYVKVSLSGGAAVYEYLTGRVSLQELAGALNRAKSSGKDIQVRVSYDRDVEWKDVMAVFNECQRAKISDCGLVPLRGIAPRS